MTHISSIFPMFLDGITFVAASTDPPDFLASVILVTSAQVTKKPVVEAMAMVETTGD